MLLEEGVTLRVEDIGHLHGRPAHAVARLPLQARSREDHGRGHVQLLQGIRRGLEVALREVEIDGRLGQVDVAEQHLDRAEVGAAF